MAQPAPPAAAPPAPGAPPGGVPPKPGESAAPSVAEIEQELIPEPLYPPFPPYEVKPIPPSVAETIKSGKDIRRLHKSIPRPPVRPSPRPARPKGAPAGTPRMTRRKLRDHIKCLKKHNVVLSDRLEYMAKPRRRTVIFLWREQGKNMPPETIARLRTMLDADQPLKPDQAYEYFMSQQRDKKRNKKKMKLSQVKKDMQSSTTDKRFLWARNASVVFARGIQQRLSRPGSISLADGMLRLSNIILGEICTHMKMRTPSRQSTNPKAKLMMDISDKVAVWIEDIIEEADDKMLMMDFDEDEEVVKGIDDEERPPPPAPGTEGDPDSAAGASTTPSVAGTPTPSTAATTPGTPGAATPKAGTPGSATPASATPGSATPGSATPKSATSGATPSGGNTPATPASGASTPATSGTSTPASKPPTPK